jgi:hypothetical protein
LKVGDAVEHARRCQLQGSEAFEHRAFFVAGDRLEVRLGELERLERAEVCRRLDQRAAAFVEQDLAQEVEALLRAGGDQHALGIDASAVLAECIGDPCA